MHDEDAHYRRAVEFWGNDIRAMIMEAQPGTDFFAEAHGLFSRIGGSGMDQMLIGADIQEICKCKGMNANDLADLLNIPVPEAYAIGAGWKRLPTHALFWVASALDVPVSAFIHRDFERLQRVHVFEAWMRLEMGRYGKP